MAEQEGALSRSLTRVFGLKDRPEGLMRPDRVVRVLRGNHRRAAGRDSTSAAVPAGRAR